MLHNETPNQEEIFATYTVDYAPLGSQAAQGMRAARPLWIDVQNGKAYPVFDVHRWSSGAAGHITYPDQFRPFPYGTGKRLNEWTVDRDSVGYWTIATCWVSWASSRTLRWTTSSRSTAPWRKVAMARRSYPCIRCA